MQQHHVDGFQKAAAVAHHVLLTNTSVKLPQPFLVTQNKLLFPLFLVFLM
jgi:hypothetical protein